MSNFILDANVLMSMLISGKAIHKTTLKQDRFYTPDFPLLEINTYSNLILSKTRLSREELGLYAQDIFNEVTVLLRMNLNTIHLNEAIGLCYGVDIKDVSYVAFASQLDFPLVTRDKPLYTGLRRKGFRSVILFEEFLASL